MQKQFSPPRRDPAPLAASRAHTRPPPESRPVGPGQTRRGRGARLNLSNRFESLHYEAESVGVDWPSHASQPAPPIGHPEAGLRTAGPKTEYLADPSRSIISYNESPDIGFDASLNPYRGCEHGCIYCYARPTHEYLGLSAGLDFETKILVKHGAPALLRAALGVASWRPQVVALSGVTDPYQPTERKLRLTRRCLEVLLEFRNPVQIITKNRLVVRDIDLLERLAGFECAAVAVSITTLDAELQRRMEPRASQPELRFDAVARLAASRVPVGVMVGPVLPGLTDHEIPHILQAAAKAGARFAGYTLLRLPHGVKDLFSDWLGAHYPERRKKVLDRIRSLRGGNLNDPRFGSRQRGSGPFAQQIEQLFQLGCRRAGLARRGPALSAASFRRPSCLFSEMELGPRLQRRGTPGTQG